MAKNSARSPSTPSKSLMGKASPIWRVPYLALPVVYASLGRAKEWRRRGRSGCLWTRSGTSPARWKSETFFPGKPTRCRSKAVRQKEKLGKPYEGKFRTAPAPEMIAPIKFVVTSCQDYPRRDTPQGHQIYPNMLNWTRTFLSIPEILSTTTSPCPGQPTGNWPASSGTGSMACPTLPIFTHRWRATS